ncbi:MAG: low-specificity L-threonine aldolase [Roseiflexaceae bacterium]|nr:low-specificity L-threonine aldolase [Roseiflexaceae bacterium]
MPPTIDLRSDTVTLPSPAMRAAMANAPLGDDVYGEDPTVNRLEQLAAETVGKPAALFVPSGTMGNLLAVLAHCGRGDEAIVGDESHILHYEAGGPSVLGGVALGTVPTELNGELPLHALAAALRDPEDSHEPISRLICLENSHNRCGGVVLRPAYTAEIGAFARTRGLATHLDGARLFNAAVALGLPAAALTADLDSVMFCLSKGLAAPVGSILAGEAAFIKRARRLRKLLGGGMRQAGVLAAAGIIALEHMVARLAEDHTNAMLLAKGLYTIPGIALDLASVQTDIVIFTLETSRWTPAALTHALAERGLLIGEIGRGRLRAVTHYGIEAADVERAVAIVREVVRT